MQVRCGWVLRATPSRRLREVRREELFNLLLQDPNFHGNPGLPKHTQALPVVARVGVDHADENLTDTKVNQSLRA
jgi:hypothetical protein